jgi:hypothetical protein
VTPTSIPGPQALRPLLGQCTVFKASNGPSYEYCGFKSVRQIFITSPPSSYYMGFFAGWQGVREKGSGAPPQIVGQLYTNGDECKGFGLRQTLVRFECQADASELTLVRMKEDNPCQYELTLASYLWCGVEEEAGTRAPNTTAPHARRRRRRRQLLAQRKEALDELIRDDVVLVVEKEKEEVGGEDWDEGEDQGPSPSARLSPPTSVT